MTQKKQNKSKKPINAIKESNKIQPILFTLENAACKLKLSVSKLIEYAIENRVCIIAVISSRPKRIAFLTDRELRIFILDKSATVTVEEVGILYSDFYDYSKGMPGPLELWPDNKEDKRILETKISLDGLRITEKELNRLKEMLEGIETGEDRQKESINNPNTEKTMKLKLVEKGSMVFWEDKLLPTIKGKDFDILIKLARTPKIIVTHDDLYKFIDSREHEDELLRQRIKYIRGAFPLPFSNHKDPHAIIKTKRMEGYYLNLAEKHVEIIE